MFFVENRKHFFRPLNGKYREQIVECLRGLYLHMFSSMADCSRAFNREQVLEVFQEAITRTPVLDEGADDEYGAPAKSEREQANWALSVLIEHGWLERLVDEATLQSTYGFSRIGRLFTQPLLETTGGRFRTRHRNTRNTRNALQSFIEQGEVYDLLDAFEYSERIISDFSDVIAELDERKRQLVREVEAQQVVQRASDEFFEFMEKRFMPDLAVRLSADSVEKYRDEIQALVNKARRKPKPFKTNAERELRRVAPELLTDPRASLYLMILSGIESRIHNASEIMLPALRQALHSFTRRADIIIRQLSFIGGTQHSELLDTCQALTELPDAEYEQRLESGGLALSVLNVGLADPGALRMQTASSQRVVNTAAEEHAGYDQVVRRELFIQRAVETAFTVSSREMREYIANALDRSGRILTHALPVRDAKELLLGAHAIEVGAAGQSSSEYGFRVEPSGNRVRTDYFDATDEFVIELIELDKDVE